MPVAVPLDDLVRAWILELVDVFGVRVCFSLMVEGVVLVSVGLVAAVGVSLGGVQKTFGPLSCGGGGQYYFCRPQENLPTPPRCC